jgi:hypothetical protein
MPWLILTSLLLVPPRPACSLYGVTPEGVYEWRCPAVVAAPPILVAPGVVVVPPPPHVVVVRARHGRPR